jgi:hypothetical protein
MTSGPPIRLKGRLAAVCLGMLALCLAASVGAAQESAHAVVLDRLVAVVNNSAILASDLDDEIRLAVLDPSRGGLGALPPQRALEQLISRALILQQIRHEDTEAVDPSQDEVNARLGEIRSELPACVHQDCASEQGWKAFLASHDLSPQLVEGYLRLRIQVLRFIELRFRQGILISPEETETYYRKTLLPQYAAGEIPPPLEKVAPRIEEILLQQRVNSLFGDWLMNLRKQGEVEMLDPALENHETKGMTGGGGA